MKSIKHTAKRAKPVIAERPAVDHSALRAYLSDLRESGEHRVPPERELAETLKLPRNQVRTILNKMAEEGLIWRQVGDGTYFGQRPLFGRGRNLADLTNPREVMEARLILEPELALLAAYRAKKSNILELESCVKHMGSTSVQSEWMFWDQRFHRALSLAAENALLSVLLETIQSNMDRETWGDLASKLHPTPRMEQSLAEHREILAQIRSRNPEGARAAMAKHLNRVQHLYFGSPVR
jgi:DNA-binding FadR family transcriptional regulator